MPGAGLRGTAADLLEELDDVHQRDPLGVPAEAVASAHAANGLEQSGATELAQHLRQVMGRHAVLAGDFRGRDLPSGVGSVALRAAAIEVAKTLGKGAVVLTVFCDTGERYLTTELFVGGT